MSGLRRATVADSGRLARIDAGEVDRWTADAYASSLAHATTTGLVAGDDGLALIRVAADEGELLRIVVAPHARRRGLGRALLEACHERFAEGGATRAFLEVRVDNGPARSLYATSGWAEAGRRRGYYGDGTDAILMSRDLTDRRGS